MTCQIDAPSSLGRFKEVVELRGTCIWLIKSIPSELGALHALRKLSISQSMRGSIPSELARLQSLSALDLDRNSITGSIPFEFGQLFNLIELNLQRNMISSSIPTELGKLQRLTKISLGENCLSNSIPSEIGFRPLIDKFDSHFFNLHRNRLIGQIPTEIGYRGLCLGRIYFNHNLLHGAVPTELGKLEHLTEFALDANSVSGSLPTLMFGKWQKLWLLSLGRNSLEGRLPSEIGKLYDLGFFGISRNFMKATLPSELFHVKKQRLDNLEVSHNCFSGAIPSEVGKLQSCMLVALDNNHFTNVIPSVWGRISAGILLLRNRLQGTIPSELGRTSLFLAWNDLTGSVPKSFFQKDYVHLHGNRLTGEIPIVDGQSRVTAVTLHSNEFGGSIPPFAFHFHREVDFPVFTAHGNHFSCKLPKHEVFLAGNVDKDVTDHFVLNCSSTLIGNSFRGPLPRWLPPSENDPLLYRSIENDYWAIFVCIVGLFGLGVAVWSVSGKTTLRSALHWIASENEYSRWVLRKLTNIFFLCTCVLWSAFILGVGFYECAEFPQNFSQLNDNYLVELFVGACFAIHYVLVRKKMQQGRDGSSIERLALRVTSSKSNRAKTPRCTSSWSCIACVGWVLFVIVLSVPAAVFTLISSLPKENTLVKFVGHFGIMLSFRSSSFLSSVIVTYTLPDVSNAYGRLCSFNSIQLEAWCRVFCLCVIPVSIIVVMHENCFGKWRLMWSVCIFHGGQGGFEVPFLNGYENLLTTSEMCETPSFLRMTRNSKCSRAIVNVMSRLLIQKAFFEIFILPCIRACRWCASAAQSNKRLTSISRWIIGRIALSECETKQFQLSLLTKSLELAIIWGPLIPALPPLTMLTCVVNLIMEEFGVSCMQSSAMAVPRAQFSYLERLEQISIVSRLGFSFTFLLCLQVSWICAAFLCLVPIFSVSTTWMRLHDKQHEHMKRSCETEMVAIES